MDIYKSRERGREDVSINTGNIEALALSGDIIKERRLWPRMRTPLPCYLIEVT